MRGVNVWQEALISAWDQVWTSFLTILPAVLGAVVVFAIGLILAYWVKRLIMEVLGVLRIEKLSGSLGIEQFLKKADVKLNLAEILGVFAQWLIILVFFLAATDILGLSSVSVVLTQVLSFSRCFNIRGRILCCKTCGNPCSRRTDFSRS